MIFNTPTLIKTGIFEGVMGIDEYKEYQKSLTIKDRENIALISITEPETSSEYPQTKLSELNPILVLWYADVIEIKFWDIEDEIAGYKPLTDEQGKQLREFIIKNKDKKFLIHCKAGQSRSAAVAKATECLLLHNGDVYDYMTSSSLLSDFKRYQYNRTVFDKIIQTN